ncbi:MAG: ATP-binding cassette domain-containing protein [Candidatus Methanoplasma sp.]|jgi:ABC-2 type transport system ATP-binding protein|nr:ATP-binding cassette domain-containing protein [Candidatus Methanoplasma sp.]
MSGMIEARGLVKEYAGGVRAVDGVDFSVAEGEIFGFLGPNGAGKSTTISMITTLSTPTSGSVFVDGIDVARDPGAVRKVIGLVPQDLTSDDDLSGRENMLLQADLYGVPRREAKERADELLEMIQLHDAADRLVDTYSGGMRKRLEVIEGLIHRPKVLFLDEPTLGLDVQTRKIIWDHILDMRREHGMTVFLTTHYLEEADFLCDRIAIIDGGRIKIVGTPDELKTSLGGDKVYIETEGVDDICDALSRLSGVRSASRDGRTYKIDTEDGDRTIRDVLSAAADNDWHVVNASLNHPSLTEVFLEYTGKNVRDQMGDSSKEEVRRQNLQSRRRQK